MALLDAIVGPIQSNGCVAHKLRAVISPQPVAGPVAPPGHAPHTGVAATSVLLRQPTRAVAKPLWWWLWLSYTTPPFLVLVSESGSFAWYGVSRVPILAPTDSRRGIHGCSPRYDAGENWLLARSLQSSNGIHPKFTTPIRLRIKLTNHSIQNLSTKYGMRRELDSYQSTARCSIGRNPVIYALTNTTDESELDTNHLHLWNIPVMITNHSIQSQVSTECVDNLIPTNRLLARLVGIQ